MRTAQVILRGFRIGSVAVPIAAGISYAVIYGMDFLFKEGCREPAPLELSNLNAVAWLILAICQVVGYRARLCWLDAWKIIVIVVSALGVYACWELYFLPPLWDNCQNIGVYDYADDFLGVDLVLLIFCVPATVISMLTSLFVLLKRWDRNNEESMSA